MTGRDGERAPLDRILDALPPASGAVVMGTGIVSVALALDGRETLSRVLLALGGAVWVVLGVLLPARALRDRVRFRADVRSPAAFTAVAGTAVLGTRLTLLGWGWAGAALLCVALPLWAGIVGPVLRGWQTPTVGASFILTVGTESLALLAAVVAFAYHAGWLLVAALAPFALGLAFYAFVVRRFDRGQLLVGQGDHWVTGGALAISTVTAGRIAIGAAELDPLRGWAGALGDLSLALWAVTMLWLPVLLVAELRRPRLRYGVRRWSTVFPVGMYAACSFVVGDVNAVAGIVRFAQVWVWVAVAVWAAVACGLGRALGRTIALAARPSTRAPSAT